MIESRELGSGPDLEVRCVRLSLCYCLVQAMFFCSPWSAVKLLLILPYLRK